jgi:hypothetical protein
MAKIEESVVAMHREANTLSEKRGLQDVAIGLTKKALPIAPSFYASYAGGSKNLRALGL